MLISHLHKFIFIHVNKTGGTAFECGNITNFFGKKDIVTPHTVEEEKMRRQYSKIRPQNYKATYPFKRTELQQIKYNTKHLHFSSVLPVRFARHAAAKKIKTLLPKVWDDYFKFCFTRNPFDKIISLITWQMQNHIDVDNMGGYNTHHYPSYFSLNPEIVEHYVLSGFAKTCHACSWEMYTENDEVIVDKVYKMEEMESALQDIQARLRFEEAIKLAKVKHLARNRSQDLKELFTPLARQVVEKACEKELLYFNYSYDNAQCCTNKLLQKC